MGKLTKIMVAVGALAVVGGGCGKRLATLEGGLAQATAGVADAVRVAQDIRDEINRLKAQIEEINNDLTYKYIKIENLMEKCYPLNEYK